MAKKQKELEERMRQIEQLRDTPTFRAFDFKKVPLNKYADTLRVLFADPDFSEAVEKRNRLVKALGRSQNASNEMANLIRAIQQHDRKLADTMYLCAVQTNLKSKVTQDFLSFDTVLKYYADYSRDGVKDCIERVAKNLDSLTFLSDMIESLLVDVKADMRTVFGDEVQFEQFDAVRQVLTQLRGYFSHLHSKSGEVSSEAQLYFDTADDINAYLGRRLKTYTTQLRKLHPVKYGYTEADMVAALNEFFDAGDYFNAKHIKRTKSGGAYMDAFAIARQLTPLQYEKLTKAVNGKMPGDETSDAAQAFCFAFTDAIMDTVKK